MNVECKNITFTYGEAPALKDISLEIQSGEFIALLGPSGCGKTTLLRLIAGLLPMQEGQLIYNGDNISHWKPQQRNTGMVFQSYALFPHLSVYENVAYGLKAKGLGKKEIDQRVGLYLEKVHLDGFEKRMIQALSGGQQQRVALARALVLKPDVLLFDEPLSNLDEKLRVIMRREIRSLQRESGITSIYVTHDQKEAMAIADQIVVMNNGQIQQIGHPESVYHEPSNEFVATFMGGSNIIYINEEKRLFRPEEINLMAEGQYTGRVNWVEYLGSIQQVCIHTDFGELIAERFSKEVVNYNVKEGQLIGFRLQGTGYRLK